MTKLNASYYVFVCVMSIVYFRSVFDLEMERDFRFKKNAVYFSKKGQLHIYLHTHKLDIPIILTKIVLIRI